MKVWVCDWEGAPCVYDSLKTIMEECMLNVHPDNISFNQHDRIVHVPGYFHGQEFEVWTSDNLS